MTSGLMPYELIMGKQAKHSDLVNIFDYDDNNLTNKPGEQKIFFEEWVKSLK